ncbi:MAG: hypothetical protein Q7T33_10165 [Dehalococcoidia bacterium]|nr:hypothetical protein [Dehalococcoidia bacterium]
MYGLRFAIPQTFDRQELQRIFWWGHREESINDPHFLDGLSWLFAQPCLTVEALVGGRWCKVREVDLSAPAQPRDLNDMRDIAGGWAAVAYHLRDHEGWRNDKIATELKRVPDSVTSRVSQLVHDGKRASKRRAGVCKLCTAKELTDSG